LSVSTPTLRWPWRSSPSADAGKRDLSKWRQLLVNEPLEPAQRCSLIAHRIGVRQQLAQKDRVGK
jgi:hypothetical protein